MTLISRLKSLLGLDGNRREQTGTTITVEREPAAESERAVKEPAPSTPSTGAAEPAEEPAADTTDKTPVEEVVEQAEQPAAETGAAEPDPVESAEPEAVEEAEPAPADAAVASGSDEPVQSLSGIGPAYAQRLAEAGVETVGDLAAADAAELDEATGLGEGRVAGWIERAKYA